MELEAYQADEVDLGFAKVYRLAPDIDEFVVNDGVEMSLENLALKLFTLEVRHKGQVWGMLVNKKNDYTYAPDVMELMGTYEGAVATAVLSPRLLSQQVLSAIKQTSINLDWNIQAFTDRDAALAWIRAAITDAS